MNDAGGLDRMAHDQGRGHRVNDGAIVVYRGKEWQTRHDDHAPMEYTWIRPVAYVADRGCYRVSGDWERVSGHVCDSSAFLRVGAHMEYGTPNLAPMRIRCGRCGVAWFMDTLSDVMRVRYCPVCGPGLTVMTRENGHEL